MKIVAIRQHAIDRFREKTNCKQSDTHIINKLFKLVDKARPVELKEQYKIREVLNHGKTAYFLSFNNWIFVVDKDTIVTVHNGEAKRWKI